MFKVGRYGIKHIVWNLLYLAQPKVGEVISRRHIILNIGIYTVNKLYKLDWLEGSTQLTPNQKLRYIFNLPGAR